MRSSLRDFWFTIDTRSLALFRILLALVLLYDLGERWVNIEAFYTVSGVLPVPAFAPLHFSLFDLIKTAGAARLAFICGAACHVALLLGWRTRWVHLGSLIFLVSARSRNPLMSHGGDGVLTALAVWTWFVPLGARWSLDARRAARHGGSPPPERCRPSLAAFAIIFQIGFIYFTTAVAKSGVTWHGEGTAIYYVLHLDQFATPLGLAIGRWPLPVLKFLTWATLGLEYSVLLFFFLPRPQPLLRRIAIVALVTFHLGTAVALVLSTFPFVMIIGYALLLGDDDWRWLARVSSRWGRPARRTAGKAKSAAHIAPGGVQEHIFNGVTAILLTSMIANSYAVTFGRLAGSKPAAVPLWLQAPSIVLDLRQGWRMFAPDPLRHDGWWVVQGVTELGQPFDPLTGRAPVWDKPAGLSTVRSPMWRMYLFVLSLPANRPYWIYFSHWLAGLSRPTPPDHRLSSFELWWVQEDTPPPGEPAPPLQRFRLWSWDGARDVIVRGDI